MAKCAPDNEIEFLRREADAKARVEQNRHRRGRGGCYWVFKREGGRSWEVGDASVAARRRRRQLLRRGLVESARRRAGGQRLQARWSLRARQRKAQGWDESGVPVISIGNPWGVGLAKVALAVGPRRVPRGVRGSEGARGRRLRRPGKRREGEAEMLRRLRGAQSRASVEVRPGAAGAGGGGLENAGGSRNAPRAGRTRRRRRR